MAASGRGALGAMTLSNGGAEIRTGVFCSFFFGGGGRGGGGLIINIGPHDPIPVIKALMVGKTMAQHL